MLRTALSIVLLLASAMAQSEKSAAASQAIVQMGAFDYRPAGVSIKAGQTVRFVNGSTYTHTVTDKPLPSKGVGSVRADELPAGEKPFESGDIDPQRFWEHKFNAPGTYRFHCRYHQMDGMSGVVTVVK